MRVEPGRGVALGPNKWGVSWVPDSTELWVRQRTWRPLQLVSAWAGAETATRPKLSVAVITATATFRATFISLSTFYVIGPHG